MYTVRVLSEIDDRLDAEYYNPEALVTINKMETKGSITTFGSLVSEGYRVVYHGTDSTNGLKDNETLPFLSPTQIDKNGAISFENTDRLPIYYKDKYPKGLGSVGEILVEVKGNVSKVGIIPSRFPKNLMISGSLYKATLDSTRADSHYILAFLKSKHGQILKNRLTSNTIINYIAKDALYSIPVIELDIITQKYIGDKVRQAEELRAWAMALELKFQKQLKTFYPEAFKDKSTGKKHSMAPIEDMSYTLNPGAFDEERLRIRLYLKKCGAVKLKEVASIEGTTSSDYSQDTTYIGLDSISSETCALSPSSIIKSGVTGTSRVLNEGVVVAKLRPYLNKISYIPKSLSGSVGSTELLCVRPLNGLNGWYIYGVLKSDIGLRQLKPLASGSTHPRIDQYDLYDLIFPIHQDSEIMGKWLENAQVAYFMASYLVISAKSLVEALIEGQLTEDQLIKAQQALEDGDNTLDKAILSKLSSEGYAVEGATPLFSDIDELYSLLASATAADSED